jgi:hypothetical protein
VTKLVAPSIEARRESAFENELLARARAWIPAWGAADNPQDFGRALLRVAARFNSEVAERLDKVGDKAYRGFFDWLAVKGDAARPARMPVVFKMAAKTTDSQLARAPVSLQAAAGSASVNFETEDDVRVLPANLAAIVGVDADADAIYLQIPGMTTLDPVPPMPTQWRLKSFAAAGATLLQLDPQVGLVADLVVAIAGAQYRFVKVATDIVTIDPPLPSGAGLDVGTLVEQVTAFAPFDPATRNRQKHALYLGHADLLNIDSAATIDIIGADVLATSVTWSYWGKSATTGDTEAWQPLTLDATQPLGALRLDKGQGSVDTLELTPGASARWIRACTAHVDGTAPLLSGGPLMLEINANGVAACPLPDANKVPQIKADAFANTTPIALSTVFYPLGKQPRQFDAFYLGCPEAFSKIGADVQLCFEMSDPSAESFSVVRGGIGPFPEKVLASVGNDHALHLDSFDPAQGSISPLYGRDPLQPPSPAYGGTASPLPPTFLDAKPVWRLPVWMVPNAASLGFPMDFRVAVTAESHVWVWGESALDQTQSGWIDFGVLPATTNATAAVDALVYLGGAAPVLAALRDGALTFRGMAPGSVWSPPLTPHGILAGTLKMLAPVLSNQGGDLLTSAGEGLVGIASNGDFYTVTAAGVCANRTAAGLRPDVQPVAFMDASPLLTVVGVDTLNNLIAVEQVGAVYNVSAPQPLPNAGIFVGHSLDAALDGSDLAAVASVLEGTDSYIVSWTPRASTPVLFNEPINVPAATVGGAPAIIGANVVVPGKNADILIGSLDLTQRVALVGDVETGIVVPSSLALNVGDVVTIGIGAPLPSPPPPGAAVQNTINGPGVTPSTETFYPVNPAVAFPAGAVTRELLAYKMVPATASNGATTAASLPLALGETRVAPNSWLLVKVAGGSPIEYWVTAVAGGSATIPGLPAAMSAQYWLPISTGGRLAPYATFIPASPNQQCPSAKLATGALVFSNQNPERQQAKAFSVAGANTTLAVMGQWWLGPGVIPSGPNSPFFLDGSVGNWTRQAGDTPSNPDLSWEYWNGAWSKLTLTVDQTQNLKSTGAVSFTVPTDITSTDWAGKSSTWIRARLIGGDYGTETVTVVTKDMGGGVTQQAIERSTSGIQPPVVVSLSISYSLTSGVAPTYVFSLDSGTQRDESVANRTGGASIEAFVPLSLTLGRLQEGGRSAPPSDTVCPSDCACPPSASSGASSTAIATAAGFTTSSAAVLAPAAVPATGRSLFLGFDKAMAGQPVNLLFMVAMEYNNDALAPLTVETLVGDRFVPVVVEDNTRALGESGILTLAFGESPTFVELFGQTRNWLKITPTTKNAAAAAAWSPNLSGVYLNAAWASATETLTRELVGSSNGAPGLTFTLQRPPLLLNTLELRVNEPLGDEEQKQLLAADPNSVIANDPNLSGQWVLWKQVVDPGDCGPADRVYGLDETSGTITFGDGQAGKIPPIGTDSIVAFKYQRTEPPAAGAVDVPANSIRARTQLNLVTPLSGVESVFSADDAAGGTPPEPDTQVLKFGGTALRNRGRAVTAVDLEDLTLASSPDIAQARAIVSATGTRLVVVMRGSNPAPSRAQQRELTRLMLTVTPAAFAAAQALGIEGPAIRRLRINLSLTVDRLDHAGAVAEDAKSEIEDSLNTLTGGRTGDGWPLGASPTADDIALALLDIDYLKSITNIGLVEVLADGTEGPWPASLKANELVQLDADALRFQFDSVEQFA